MGPSLLTTIRHMDKLCTEMCRKEIHRTRTHPKAAVEVNTGIKVKIYIKYY